MGRVSKFRQIAGVDELQFSSTLWKALPAEFIGTGFLVLVACGACVGGFGGTDPSVVEIALAFGLIVATMVQCVCSVSGGHINPAVTAGMMAAGKCSLLRGALFIIMQCTGAVAGSALLQALTPDEQAQALGKTAVNPSLGAGQGVGVEFCITFVLVFTVFAVCDPNRVDVRGSAPLAIGFSITACHLWAVRYTGASMNSARSFGPALILNDWDNHWVYWVGPILGGVVAGLIYEYLLNTPPPSKDEVDRAKMIAMSQYADKDSSEQI